MRFAILLALWVSATLAADSALQYSRTLGGSRADAVNAITVDGEGNIVVAGTGTSFDFPVTNGSMNPGTEFSVSDDAGKTWKPLSNLPAGLAQSLAVDSSPSPVLYAGGTSGVFKSTDGGLSWSATARLPIPECIYAFYCGVSAVVVDPVHPSIVYAGTNVGLFKSTDSARTWSQIGNGPEGYPNFFFVDYLAVDPFHTDTIFTSIYGKDYQSSDGGQTWSRRFLPLTGGGSIAGPTVRVAFDPFTSGLVYQVAPGGIYRSADGGGTWTMLSAPSSGAYSIAIDPLVRGALYLYSGKQVFHSGDGGATWQESTLTRGVQQLAFDPRIPLRVFSYSLATRDVFVSKLDPSGQNLLFSTYLGGQGDGTAKGVATDAAGNVYVTGWTDNVSFVAKLDAGGNRVYTTKLEHGMMANAITVDSQGSAVVAGIFYKQTDADCFVAKLSPDGASLVYSTSLGGRVSDGCESVAVDANDNVIAGGWTQSADFPVTAGALQNEFRGPQSGMLAKIDANGNLLSASYLGGNNRDRVAAVAVDEAGNILVAGQTSSKEFSTTPGAYQTALRANCAYPSSAFATGMFGTITAYQMDDVFVTKLDPSGSKVMFSTLLGGDCYDVPTGMAVDGSGNVWIAGSTNSNPFPQASPFESGPPLAYYKAFVSKLDASGSSLLFSSYIGAGGTPSLAVDADGSAYVGGTTEPPRSRYSGPPAPPPIRYYQGVISKIAGNPAVADLGLNSVGNAFSMRDGPISPGEIVAIAVDGLNPLESVDLGLNYPEPLPSVLADAQVLFDGEAAPMISVDAGKIACIAPSSLADKKAVPVEVRFGNSVSNSVRVDVLPSDLGLLSADRSGGGQAYAFNEDGTLNSPDNPAAHGSVVTIFFTGGGLGDLSRQVATAFGAPLDVSPLPGFVPGLYQLLVRLPASQAANPATVFSIFSSSSTSQTLTIAVK